MGSIRTADPPRDKKYAEASMILFLSWSSNDEDDDGYKPVWPSGMWATSLRQARCQRHTIAHDQ
jgi:hypothetical protein